MGFFGFIYKAEGVFCVIVERQGLLGGIFCAMSA